jgi:hypothetical protein
VHVAAEPIGEGIVGHLDVAVHPVGADLKRHHTPVIAGEQNLARFEFGEDETVGALYIAGSVAGLRPGRR